MWQRVEGADLAEVRRCLDEVKPLSEWVSRTLSGSSAGKSCTQINPSCVAQCGAIFLPQSGSPCRIEHLSRCCRHGKTRIRQACEYIPDTSHFIRRQDEQRGPSANREAVKFMNIVIFGLTVSSSWGNGHATLWRSLIKALLRRGHRVLFYEKDVPYYADARDLHELGQGGRLCLYREFDEIREAAALELDRTDLAIYTSYCPDGALAAALMLNSKAGIKCFYDLDTPITLDALARNEPVSYLLPDGLSAFDLVLSYTGGRALEELRTKLGARVVAPLYGSVDPELHHPVTSLADFTCSVSYLGTYAEERFLIGGSQYPDGLRWPANVDVFAHMPPQNHSAFFSSSRMTLNITRKAMADYGYCPSGRLFEAAACGTPILSDSWDGLASFFVPGEEILLVSRPEEVMAAMRRSDSSLRRVGEAARAKALREHTGDVRIIELERLCRVVLESMHAAAVV